MSGYAGERIGMGHRKHPLLGQQVVDGAHEDRIGILRAVAPEVDTSSRHRFISESRPADDRSELERAECVAWISPIRGGAEWPTPLDMIRKYTEQ